MDQGLKERLIGAAVLVALGVWLIPWLLDGAAGPTKETKPALELPVPEEGAEAELRTEVIDLDAEQPPSPAGALDTSAARRAERSDAVEREPLAAEGRASAPAGRAAAPTGAANESPPELHTDAAPESTPPPSAATGAASSAASSSAARPSSEPSSAGQTSATQAAAASAQRAEEAEAKAAVAATGAGAWAVQLGSFGDKQNAERLASRAGVFGTKPQISTYKADGRLMYRVRLGPYPTRERAEAAASSLGVHGFVARVVAAD